MIVVENLTKRFDGKTVLNNVSLEIHEGETFAIIGRSGSGKSVLMKHIIGLMKPDEGHVWIDDVNINQVSYKTLRGVRQKFGVLFQGGALFDSMNAFDNVAFPLRMFTRMKENEIYDRVMNCLSVVSLPEAGNKRISELSGGMQKRVACARAIALNPKYVFYDEPNSGLDPLTSGTINDLIATLSKKERVTGIVVTHDMHSVLKIADRAAFIHKGNLHWLGTVEDLHRSTDAVLLEFVKASEYKIGY
ncbi:MAG: ABC transporter ATP-binding protein [Bacteroidetes Order II. Incertae sedis bacterium]|nr:ABC transporter ATP-binding protein [Bacteroidetes Order II. bacterium]